MPQTLTRERPLSAEEFWDFCAASDAECELVDGRVLEMPPPGGIHGRIDGRLARALANHVEANALGEVFPNTGFILRRRPDTIRAPDQAFVSVARIRANPPPDQHWPIAPDLVVEIISPGERPRDVQAKVDDSLQAGVRMVWAVYSQQRDVHVFRPGAEVQVMGEHAVLSGDDVVPGFAYPLADLWG